MWPLLAPWLVASRCQSCWRRWSDRVGCVRWLMLNNRRQSLGPKPDSRPRLEGARYKYLTSCSCLLTPPHPSVTHTRTHHQPDSSPPGLSQWACYKVLSVWVQSRLDPCPKDTYILLIQETPIVPKQNIADKLLLQLLLYLCQQSGAIKQSCSSWNIFFCYLKKLLPERNQKFLPYQCQTLHQKKLVEFFFQFLPW